MLKVPPGATAARPSTRGSPHALLAEEVAVPRAVEQVHAAADDQTII
jgi:hypothetical protein